MPRLVLINGAPGPGKSNLATTLAQDRPLYMALEIDNIKHTLGQWSRDPIQSGLHVRRLSIVLCKSHLEAGYDVIIGQYLARTSFIEDLENIAKDCHAVFYEFVLRLSPDAVEKRIDQRNRQPNRSEHYVNRNLVQAADATELVDFLTSLYTTRPYARWVDASGTLEQTAMLIRDDFAEKDSAELLKSSTPAHTKP